MPTFRSEAYERTRLKKMARWAEGRTVLDIGYAHLPNPYLDPLKATGFDREMAIDCAYAEKIQGDVRELGEHLAGRTFGAILAGEFIEHVEDPYAFLRTTRKFLAPGGRLILSTPNPVGIPTVVFEWIRSRRFFYSEDHTFYFAPRWVERMFEHCGYGSRRVEAVGLWPFGAFPVPVGLGYQVIYVAEPIAGVAGSVTQGPNFDDNDSFD